MKMRRLDLVSFNFESYSRNEYKVTITMRSHEKGRQKLVIHSVDFKSLLTKMREVEAAMQRAAEDMLAVAAGSERE